MNKKSILKLTDVLATHLPPEEAFRALAMVLHEELAVDRASLTMFDEQRGDFICSAVELDEESKWRSGFRLPMEGTRVGHVFTTQEPQLAKQLSAESDFSEDAFLAEEGMTAGMTLPLTSMGKAIGTFNVDWRSPDALTPEIADLLNRIAEQFATSSPMAWWVPKAERGMLNKYTADALVLKRPSLQRDLKLLKRMAGSNASILIRGETGTGKGVMARALHIWSQRPEGPFVICDCSAITASLIESDLFGHERGSFTGASRQRLGSFEQASRGTIFLDEIGELPVEFQPKLLGVLEDRQLVRVGGSHPLSIDVRVISATNRDLATEMAGGNFRSDLYHRLGVLEYVITPLRDCPEDISVLSELFVESHASNGGRRKPRIAADAKAQLLNFDWPGNVRELSNVVERWMLFDEGHTLTLEGLLMATRSQGESSASRSLRDLESEGIFAALEQCDWKINGTGGAAEVLGLHPSTLRSRMKKLGIHRPH